MSEEAIRLDNQLCFRLYKLSRTMTRLYQPILESMNITYPQYVTMLVLWESERIDFKDLGKRLDLKTGTLTPILNRLESLGFILKEKNKEDSRRVWIVLTDEGRSLKGNALKIPALLNTYMNMDLDQYHRFVTILDELDEILDRAEIKQKDEVKR
ncbi:MAG: MarR family transcriptional regulator [Spirochaetales bacterium]|nr:MarR family transcriptional regulator [Spirochaetales bacterium]